MISQRRLVIPIALNGIFLLLFWFVDILISSNFGSQDVSMWATFKSVLFISSGVATLGIDMTMVKYNVNPAAIIRPFFIQAFVLSSLIGLLVYAYLGIDYFLVTISVLALSIFLFFSAASRSAKKFNKSIFILHGWKGVIFILLIFRLDQSLYSLILVAMLVVLGLVIASIKILEEHDKEDYYFHVKDTGISFLFASLALNVAIYADQILLRLFTNAVEIEFLFRHTLVFVFPLASLSGIFGNILTPFLRDRPTLYVEMKAKIRFSHSLFLVFVLLLILWFSLWFYQKLFESYPNWHLALGLYLIGMMRLIFVLPSAFYSSIASSLYLKTATVYFHVFNFLYIGLTVILIYFDLSVLFSLVLGISIMWFLRLYLGLVHLRAAKCI